MQPKGNAKISREGNNISSFNISLNFPYKYTIIRKNAVTRLYKYSPCTDAFICLRRCFSRPSNASRYINPKFHSLLRDNNCFQHLPSRRETFFHRSNTRYGVPSCNYIQEDSIRASGKHRKRNPHGMTVTTGGSFPWPVESHSSSPLLAASIPETEAGERVRTPLRLSLSLSAAPFRYSLR